MPSGKPVTFKAFDGINNVAKPFRLKPSELTEALNVDVNDARALDRRGGHGAPLASTSGSHSIFYPFNAAPDVILYRRSTTLYRLLPDLVTSIALKTGLTAGAPMFYVAAGNRIFMSDGFSKLVTDGERVWDWGIKPPARQPVAAASGSGRMPKGRYLFAVTFLRADGEESGTPESGAIDLAGGGIDFSAIPVSAQADVTVKAIYLTKPNGKQLFRAFIVPNAATSGSYYGTTADFRAKLATQFRCDPPPGRVLEHHNGRLLVADGRFVWYNPTPYQYEQFQALKVVPHARNVNAIACMDDGVFVGTDNLIDFHAGADFAAPETIRSIAKYGACFGGVAYVEGARVRLPGRAALMVTKEGICVCGNGGAFTNVTLGRYKYNAPQGVAAVARDMGGYAQLLAVMR